MLVCVCVCVCVCVWLVTTLNKNAYVWLKIMYYNCWGTFFNEFVDACTHAWEQARKGSVCVCKMRWWRGKRPFPTGFVQADWVKEWIQYCWWRLDTLCMYACDVNDLKKTCIQLLTPSLPWCHWKMTNKSAKFETFKLLSSFSHWRVKGVSSKRAALQADVSYDPKIYCVQACLCIFQPGNFTGWGSDGVSNCNSYNENLYWLGMLQWHFLFKLCNSNMITSTLQSLSQSAFPFSLFKLWW